MNNNQFQGNGVWAVTAILQDLIEELRDMFGTHEEAYGRDIGLFPIGGVGDEVRDYITRAQQRLREVQNADL